MIRHIGFQNCLSVILQNISKNLKSILHQWIGSRGGRSDLFVPSLGFWETKIKPVFVVRVPSSQKLDCIVTKCSHDIVIMIIG